MSYLLYHINPDLLQQDLQKYSSSLDKFLFNIVWKPFVQYKTKKNELYMRIESDFSPKFNRNCKKYVEIQLLESIPSQLVPFKRIQGQLSDVIKESKESKNITSIDGSTASNRDTTGSTTSFQENTNRGAIVENSLGHSNHSNIASSTSNSIKLEETCSSNIPPDTYNNGQSNPMYINEARIEQHDSMDISDDSLNWSQMENFDSSSLDDYKEQALKILTANYSNDEIQSLTYFGNMLKDLELKRRIIFGILYNALNLSKQLNIEMVQSVLKDDNDTFSFLCYLSECGLDTLLLKKWHLQKGNIEEVMKNYEGVEKETAFYLLSISKISEAREIFERINDSLWVDNCDWILGGNTTNSVRKLIFTSEKGDWESMLHILEDNERISFEKWNEETTNKKPHDIEIKISEMESLRYNIWMQYVLKKGGLDQKALKMLASNLIWQLLNSRMSWIIFHPTDTRNNGYKYLFQDRIFRDMLTSKYLAMHTLCKLYNIFSLSGKFHSTSILKLVANIKEVVIAIVDYYPTFEMRALLHFLNTFRVTEQAVKLLNSFELNQFPLSHEEAEFNQYEFIDDRHLYPENEFQDSINFVRNTYLKGDTNTTEDREVKKRRLGMNLSIRKRLKANHLIFSKNFPIAKENREKGLQSFEYATQHIEFIDYLIREMIFRERHFDAKQFISFRKSNMISHFVNDETDLRMASLLCDLNDLHFKSLNSHEESLWKIESAFQQRDDDSKIVDKILELYTDNVPETTILSELAKHLFNLNSWVNIRNIFTHFQSNLQKKQYEKSSSTIKNSLSVCSFALRLAGIVSCIQSFANEQCSCHSLVEEINLFCDGLFRKQKVMGDNIGSNEENIQVYKMSVVGVHYHHIHLVTSCRNTQLKKLVIGIVSYYLYSIRSLKKQPTNLFRNLAEVYLQKEVLYTPSVMNIVYQQETTGEEQISALDSILCDILRILLQSLKNELERINELPKFPVPIYTYILTLADVHFERKNYIAALKYYLMACSNASDHFSKPVPDEVLTSETIKRMIHTLRVQRKFTESAVMCQFLSLGYDQSFIQDLKSFNMKWAQYFWDEGFLELLLYIAHWNQDQERENILLKLLERGDMNVHNPVERITTFVEKLKSTFFGEIYRETWYGGFE